MGLFLKTDDGHEIKPLSIDSDGEIINESLIAIYASKDLDSIRGKLAFATVALDQARVNKERLMGQVARLGTENDELKYEVQQLNEEIVFLEDDSERPSDVNTDRA